MNDTKLLRTQEIQDYKEDSDLSKIFGFQKVKLYKIKHIILDFGGVLTEKTYARENLFNIIESDLKIKIPRSENSYYRKLFRQTGSGIISSREFIEKVFKKYYYPSQKENGILPVKKVNSDYYLELWFQLYSKFSHLIPDMEHIIQQLHQAGYTVSLMANTFDIPAKSNELKGFYNLFDHVFLSHEIGLRKPDLEQYKYVIKKLKTKPKKCIFIDDKLRNLIPARQLGINVIKFESIEKFKEQLKELGIRDISKLSRHDIKKQHKQYEIKKKEFRKAKKTYKDARKNFLKKKKGSSQKKEELQKSYAEYVEKKKEYIKEKEKRNKLITRIRIA